MHAIQSLSLVLVLLAGLPVAAEESSPPNIVYLLADDLGWNDVSFHGSEIPTPNVDRIAREGAQLNRFYVCPVCSPTRAGLMTGRWPIRFGLMRAVLPPWRDYGLPTSEVTLPEILAGAGYKRRGIFGKWHLGHSRLRYHPLNRGFTRFYGHYNGAIDYFTHEREGELDWHDGFDASHDTGYSTDLLATAAVQFIHRSAGDGPFLLYVPFNAVHGPFQAKDEDLEIHRAIANQKRRTLAAMDTALDRAIGRILEALDQTGVAGKTLVWFSSDNGGLPEPTGNNRPLRGHKADVFEGGVRVAAAARWPGKIPAGSTVDDVMGYIDVVPTLMHVAGVTDRDGPPLDGINVLPALLGEAPLPERKWFHYIGQGGEETEKISLLDGPWKLVCLNGNVTDPAHQDRRQVMLFDLAHDPEEQHDLAGDHPERVKAMLQDAAAFRRLQPEQGVLPYNAGKRDFQAPPEWKISAE